MIFASLVMCSAALVEKSPSPLVFHIVIDLVSRRNGERVYEGSEHALRSRGTWRGVARAKRSDCLGFCKLGRHAILFFVVCIPSFAVSELSEASRILEISFFASDDHDSTSCDFLQRCRPFGFRLFCVCGNSAQSWLSFLRGIFVFIAWLHGLADRWAAACRFVSYVSYPMKRHMRCSQQM